MFFPLQESRDGRFKLLLGQPVRRLCGDWLKASPDLVLPLGSTLEPGDALVNGPGHWGVVGQFKVQAIDAAQAAPVTAVERAAPEVPARLVGQDCFELMSGWLMGQQSSPHRLVLRV